MTTRPTPATNAISTDPAIERRDVPARVWREMAQMERQRDEAVEFLRECALIISWQELSKQSLIGTLESVRAFLARLEKGREVESDTLNGM